MDSKEMYQIAYDLHYSKSDIISALEIYKELIERFPDSIEAGYAKAQIVNIDNMSESEKQRHSEKKETVLEGATKQAKVNEMKAIMDDESNLVNSIINKESSKFKTLLGYAIFISVVGWLIMFLALIALLRQFAVGEVGLLEVGIIVFVIIQGLILVVSGQSISCFVSIEKNTRMTCEILKLRNINK